MLLNAGIIGLIVYSIGLIFTFSFLVAFHLIPKARFILSFEDTAWGFRYFVLLFPLTSLVLYSMFWPFVLFYIYFLEDLYIPRYFYKLQDLYDAYFKL